MSRHVHGIAAAAIAATLVLPTAMMVGCGGSGADSAQPQGSTGSETQGQLFDEFGNKKDTKQDGQGDQDSQSANQKDNSKKSDDANDANAKNAKMLQDTLGIAERGADEAATIIADLGVGELKSMKIVPGTTKTVTVVDVYGKTYVLEFSQMGYLHVVREESTDGKIIFGVAS